MGEGAFRADAQHDEIDDTDLPLSRFYRDSAQLREEQRGHRRPASVAKG